MNTVPEELKEDQDFVIRDLSIRFANATLFFRSTNCSDKDSAEYWIRYRSELECAEEILDRLTPSSLSKILTEIKVENQSDVTKVFLIQYLLTQLLKVEGMLESSLKNK